MNSVSINLHDYCNKLVNLHNYTQTDVSHFKVKLYNFYTFFFYITRILLNSKGLLFEWINKYEFNFVVSPAFHNHVQSSSPNQQVILQKILI